MHIFLYGPPGAGKTTLGRALADALDLPFLDLDDVISAEAGRSIPEIFAAEGEAGFRRHEMAALDESTRRSPAVIALGGGALLDPRARELAESRGQVLCLSADFPQLMARTMAAEGRRPLLNGDPEERLRSLLSLRQAHYHSFQRCLDTSQDNAADLIWPAQLRLGAFRVRGMGQAYDVRVERGGLARLGQHFQARGLKGPVALVSDRNVAAHYLEPAAASLREAGYAVHPIVIEPGEANKTLETVQAVWNAFIQAGIERGSTVAALGGGVVGDLVGFAAATFLRGVAWVNLPTSLLAMVDSSLGGKTGVDLPQAKNLVGAFHSPRLVLADPDVLSTLPERELRNGLGEVVKHGVIDDPDLFELCGQGWAAVTGDLERVVRQGMAVKLKVIEADPYEKGLRQALNLGHTIGHGVELASDFRLGHGEAVGIGMVAEARLAESLGLAQPGLAQQIAGVLAGLRLPVEIPPELDRQRIAQAVQLDKKKAAGQVRFALPLRVGEVRVGIVVEDWQERI